MVNKRESRKRRKKKKQRTDGTIVNKYQSGRLNTILIIKMFKHSNTKSECVKLNFFKAIYNKVLSIQI